MLTVCEFLSRLVTAAGPRFVFEADPRGSVEHAHPGETSRTDVVRAALLVLDHARVEVVDDVRAAQSGPNVSAAPARGIDLPHAVPRGR